MGLSLKVLVHLFVLNCIVGIALSNPFNDLNLSASNIDNANEENTRETRVVEMIPLANNGNKVENGVGRLKEDSGVIKAEDFDASVPEIAGDSDADSPQISLENPFGSHEASIPLTPVEADSNVPSIPEGATDNNHGADLGNRLNIPNLPITIPENRATYGRDVDTKLEDATDYLESILDDNYDIAISESLNATETSELQESDSQIETNTQSERQDFDYYGDYSNAGSIDDYGIDNDLYNYGSNYDIENTDDDYGIGGIDYGVEGDNYNTGDIDYGIDNYNQGEGDYDVDNYNLGGNYDLGSEYSSFDDYGDHLVKTQRELEKQIDATQRKIESLLTQL